MATALGKSGYLKIGTGAVVTVGEIKGYSLSSSSDTVEDTVIGDTFRTRKATLKTWSCSGEVFWDPIDAGQILTTIGTSVTVNLYPAGITTGLTYMTGQGIVTQFDVTGRVDSMVEATFAVEGSGTLTISTA